MRDGSAEDKVLPVSIHIAHKSCDIVALGGSRKECIGHILTELPWAHCLDFPGVLLYADTSVVGNGRSAGKSSLCSDYYDTIGCARAVDCRRRCVLEHGERIDVVRVEHIKRVGHSLTSVVCDRNTVNHDERVVGGVEGSGTADTDCRA